MVEAGRTVLLRRMGRTMGTLRDRVPVARWVLAPWRTWLLWRRMVLWQVTSYREAVDTELELRRAIALLRTRYGRRWRRHAPADLVWMLRTGPHVGEAYARVFAMVGAEGIGSDERSVSPGREVADNPNDPSCGRSRPRLGCRPDRAGNPDTFRSVEEVDRHRFGEAVELNREHWVRTGRPISAETLRRRLRLGAAKSRVWCRAIRAEDRELVCGVRAGPN
jgi:hypothetical protein